MRRIKKTKYYSQVLGDMPDGCKQCVKGEKLVLFITGVCNSGCYYCPLSEQKKNKDHVWANEWKIQKKQDILEEARLCSSKGAGITGGDPFLKVDRVTSSIRMLKKEFGDDFHVHLYAPLINITNGRLKRIYKSGLDEIRFHPDIRNNENWDKIDAARKYKWKIGVEIPVIPDKKKETIKLINYIKNKVDFLNLNELEISDTNACKLSDRGYKTKDEISFATSSLPLIP